MHTEFTINWRRHWLNCLAYFASLRDQRQHWLDPDQKNPHWSYVEIMCEYFDDCSLSDGYQQFVDGGMISEVEWSLVRPWHTRLAVYQHPTGNDYDNDAVLKDPEWIGICRDAARLRKALLAVVSDPAERGLLE